jgi:sulfofructose kinase
VALHALRLAQRLGIPVVADLERTTPPEVLVLAREVDHLIVGAEFARQVTGERDPAMAVRGLYSPAHQACVVTGGDQGCWYMTRASAGTVYHRPACRVPVIDTTGCGDVFHGAYAACIAAGEGIERAVAVATAAAALKATQPGGRRGIPDRPTVEKFLQQQCAGRAQPAHQA